VRNNLVLCSGKFNFSAAAQPACLIIAGVTFMITGYNRTMDRRIILPALFGILTIAAAAAYASVFLILPLPAAVKVIIAALFTAIAAAMAYVIVQRTKELKEEDKDDIGKY
jgi:heme A synthase